MCTKTSVNETETAVTIDTAADAEKHVVTLPTVAAGEKVSPGKRQRIRNTLRKAKQKEDGAGTLDARFLGERIPEKQSHFWTRPIFMIQYFIITAALVSRRLWVLQGILLVLSALIAHILYEWIQYILRDPQLRNCVTSMRWYFGFAMRQAEATVKGGKGRRMVEAGVLAWRGTATSFLQWFFRQRSNYLNQILIQQHQSNMERLKRWSIRN